LSVFVTIGGKQADKMTF